VLDTGGCVTVAVWSGVNIAGTRLQDLHPDIGRPNDPENWNEVHRDVINRCFICNTQIGSHTSLKLAIQGLL